MKTKKPNIVALRIKAKALEALAMEVFADAADAWGRSEVPFDHPIRQHAYMAHAAAKHLTESLPLTLHEEWAAIVAAPLKHRPSEIVSKGHELAKANDVLAGYSIADWMGTLEAVGELPRHSALVFLAACAPDSVSIFGVDWA